MDELQKHQMQLAFDPAFQQGVDRLRNQFKNLEKDTRVRYIQQLSDSEREKDLRTVPREIKDRIKCRKGCSHCCYIMCSVTNDEADLLVEKIKELGIKIDVQRLQAQARSAGISGQEYIAQVKHKDRRCIFLNEEDACSVYDFRPLTCRNYIALDGPDQCDTREGTLSLPCFASKKLLMIEMAAALVCSGPTFNPHEFGLMAHQLLRRL